MKLVCPHCNKVVDVADSLAGQSAECTICHGPFTVPTDPPSEPPMPLPRPSQPLPPPPPYPPAPDPLAPATDWRKSGPSVIPPLPQQDTVPVGGPRALAWLNKIRDVVLPGWVHQWSALIVLVLLFILQFTPWVGVYCGDTTLAQQRGSSMPFGALSAEKDFAFVGKDMEASMLMLLYFLATLAGLLLCIAVLLVENFGHVPALKSVQPTLEKIAAMKDVIVAILLALTALILLLFWLVLSFPLEKEVQGEKAAQIMAQGLKLKVTATELEVKSAEMVPMQWLHRRSWFCLTLLINVIAALVVGCKWCEARGYCRNWPKLKLQWPGNQS